MAWYSAALTLVVLAVTALLGGVIAVMLGPYRRRLRHLYEAEAQRQSLLVESVHGMRTVKSLNLEPRREETWDNAAADAGAHLCPGRQDFAGRQHLFASSSKRP